MDPISNVDAIVLLLRQRLMERSRALGAARADAVRSGRETMVRQDPLHALAAVGGLDDLQLGRALVESVMIEHFGARMVNEPQFQQVVDQVSETLKGEPQAAKLLQRLLGELRISPR